ncbi:MAG: DUF4397 domain-containing protein [Gemmatimonadaceae bacterium]
MTNYRSGLALLCAAVLSACGQDAIQTLVATNPGAHIKFYNFGVGAPDVNFYADQTKVTAVSSSTGTEATTGTAYGKSGNGGFYSGVEPKAYVLAGKIASATNNGVAISTLNATLADGKYYSFYQSGIYDATAKTVDSFIVEDPFPSQIDFSTANVRFVNAISNSSPMTLYAKETTSGVEAPVGAEISYKGAGAFTALPSGIYNLSTRTTGSSTNVISLNGITILAGRLYTVTAGGDMTSTTTTKPFLDNSVNR